MSDRPAMPPDPSGRRITDEQKLGIEAADKLIDEFMRRAGIPDPPTTDTDRQKLKDFAGAVAGRAVRRMPP